MAIYTQLVLGNLATLPAMVFRVAPLVLDHCFQQNTHFLELVAVMPPSAYLG